MEKWQESRNYRRIKDESGEIIANIITVDGVDVEVTEEVYLAYGAKRIYVSEASATIHEFGHFVDSIVNDSAEWDRLYQAEASDSILRDYAKTNSREYFADCFAYWVLYSGNEKRMESFQNTAPQTYAYMEMLAASNWGC